MRKLSNIQVYFFIFKIVIKTKNYLAQSYNDSVKECQQEIENIAHADKIVVTILLDGWKNVLKQNILVGYNKIRWTSTVWGV
jgi:hypothetical protein